MAITALPTPPSRQDPANFSDRADAFLGALPTFATEANALATDVNAKQVTTSAAAITAVSAASAAALSEANAASTANFKGTWSSLTGALNKPATVSHNGTIWALLNNLANVALSQPGVTADWVYVSGSGAPYTPTTALVTQAVMGGRYALTNATTQAAATNLLTYSQQLDNAAWVRARCSVTADSTYAPDGTFTADKLVEDSSVTNDHFAANGYIGFTAGTTYTLSVFVKGSGRTSVQLYIPTNSWGDAIARAVTYDLVGVVVQNVEGSGASGSIVAIGDGWFRLTMTFTPTITTGNNALLRLCNATFNSYYTGDGTSGVYFWGMQLETGSVSSSYIQTTSAPVTRLAGVIAPQRIILPASPATNTQVDVVSANTADTNIIDPNGSQFYGTGGPLAGPMRLDSKNAKISLQFINNFWRAI